MHLAARRAASSSPQDRVAAALKLTDEIIGDRPEPRESFAWRVAESIATWTLAVAFCFLLWFLLFFFMVL